MWSKSYSKRVAGLKAEQVWAVWTNINQWNLWQSDIEYATIKGEFQVGTIFNLKPKGGPRVKIELIEVVPFKSFTDLTRFPGAKMYGSHEFRAHGDALEIKTTMRIECPLSFLWKKLVAEDIANGMPEETESLINKVING